jgi:hypothetical protein
LSRRRRLLLLAALAAYAWTIAITLTGGFVIRTAWVTASSRNPRGPFIVALVLLAAYALRYRQHWREDGLWLARPLRLVHPDRHTWLADERWPRAAAALCASGALIIGIGWGSFLGAGPDASGYVSQADMWVRGVLTLPAPEWARNAPWPYGVWSASPVGYGPTYDGRAIAPMYSPGLPMMMAIFQIAGGSNGVYYVVPLLGAVTVWGAYLLGRGIGGAWAGAMAALLLVCSPPFIWMIVQPMSDVPVTACWTMALVFALRQRPSDAIAAGVATAAALLVRPNVAPLAIVPVLLLAARDARARRLMLFAIVPAVAAAIVAALNWHLNGSPLRSGYGTLDEIYGIDRVPLNLDRYTTWLLDKQTPLFFVGLLAPLAVRPGAGRYRVALLTTLYPLIVLAHYLPYAAFEHWAFLRFLLPAYPAVLAGVGTLLVEAVRRSRQPLVAIAAVVLVVFVALHGWQAAKREAAFQIATYDQRYARVVDYVRAQLPADAVIVSNVHSGTLRFYTGREVLRFEVMRPEDVDPALAYLRSLGRPVYFIGDTNEIDHFTDLFRMTRAAGQFGRPTAELDGVVVFDWSRATR